MKALRNYLDKIKPNFEEGGKYHAFRSVFDGFETFLFVPNATSKTGTHIHDAIDSKRIMSFVVIALMPALLFGMYNVGYQHYHAAGVEGSFMELFGYGFLAVLPKIIVSYVVGLGIEFIVAQWKKEEIQEGFLVTGMLIPMIVPVDCPLWMLAVATAFSVIFCKEVFGGTGMNIFNPALITRAFLFFAYPTKMSGDTVCRVPCFLVGYGDRSDSGLYRRDERNCHCYRCRYLVMVGRGKLENDVVCICRRCCYGLGVQSMGTGYGSCPHALVRTFVPGWFLFRRCIYGDRPGHFFPYGERQVCLRIPDWRDGNHYPCIESGLSGGHDAGNPADEYLCTAD